MAIDKTTKTRIVITVSKDLKEKLEIQAKKENRTVANLVMAVGIVANHAISIQDKNGKYTDYFLADFFEPQTSIVFQIKNVSIADYIFHHIK